MTAVRVGFLTNENKNKFRLLLFDDKMNTMYLNAPWNDSNLFMSNVHLLFALFLVSTNGGEGGRLLIFIN